MEGLTPLCPYCGVFSKKVTGEVIYPHRPDLHHKTFYQCQPCDAYVGTHPGTDKPLGGLADATLRHYKSKVHQAFDPLWRTGVFTRKEAYARLAFLMGLPVEDCHIGMFTVEDCHKALELCKNNLSSNTASFQY